MSILARGVEGAGTDDLCAKRNSSLRLRPTTESAFGAVTVVTGLLDPSPTVHLPVRRPARALQRLGGSLQPGTPGTCSPLTCPKLARSRLGSGLRTAPPNKR
jgi:hypothetical protein